MAKFPPSPGGSFEEKLNRVASVVTPCKSRLFTVTLAVYPSFCFCSEASFRLIFDELIALFNLLFCALRSFSSLLIHSLHVSLHFVIRADQMMFNRFLRKFVTLTEIIQFLSFKDDRQGIAFVTVAEIIVCEEGG